MDGRGPGSGPSPHNTLRDNPEPADLVDSDGILDDKLLEAVTPRIALFDEAVMDDVKPTFCTRCRTISASFLSSPYITGSSDGIGNHDSCQGRGDPPQTRLFSDDVDSAIRGSHDDSDDVPLLHVSFI